MTKEKTMLKRACNAYAYLYEDQQVGATDEYLEFLESDFGPAGIHDWTNKEYASSALRHLLCEIYESCTEDAAKELLALAGVDDELKEFIGFIDERKEEPATPAVPAEPKSAKWLEKLAAIEARGFYSGMTQDMFAVVKKIPAGDYDEALVQRILGISYPMFFVKHIWKYIPECFTSKKEFLVSLAKADKPSILRDLPNKEVITKEVAEAILDEVGMTALSSIPQNVRKTLDLNACLEKDPRALSGIPQRSRTVEMCEKAIMAAIERANHDSAFHCELYNKKWFEWAITAVPGGPNALSMDVKCALVRKWGHTLKIFAENGAFSRHDDGSYTEDAWTLFFAGMEYLGSAGYTITYAPVEMVRLCCLRAKKAGKTIHVSEFMTDAASA